MQAVSDPVVNDLLEDLKHLNVNEEDTKEVGAKEEELVVDDGYNSDVSNTEPASPVEDKAEEIPAQTAEAEEDDDERILEPLVILQEELPTLQVEFVSRGPVAIENMDNRFQPYAGRPGRVAGDGQGQHRKQDDDKARPLPNVLIYTKKDQEHPTQINVNIEWSDQHELCVHMYRLPEDACFVENTSHVQVFVQLNPLLKDTKSFLADVKYQADENGQNYGYIGPIVISLKTDLAESQEKLLLAAVSEEDRLAAQHLVSQKEITQLVSGIGPHKDTVIAILCAQRKSNPGQVMAQVHAVVHRLLKHPEEKVHHTVFKLNNNGISAFEIAAITNNSFVACYLAEVMYNMIDDTRTALRILNGKDSQGNTIIHLLARKGDSNATTLWKLLAMRLTDGTCVFSLGTNSKKQTPMHIAVQSSNQPETIAVLYQALNRAFELQDDDGMTPLHYACQRTTDPDLIITVLSYHKDNINLARNDGLTALDLLAIRPNKTTNEQNAFPINLWTQRDIEKLLRNNGAVSSFPEPPHSPTGAAGSTHIGGMMSPNTPHSPASSSPVCSPYDSSIVSSPRTIPEDCPAGYYSSMRVQGSVESYIQSSPESDHEEPTSGAVGNYSFMPTHIQREDYSVSGAYPSHTSLEENLASQIFLEFPEIRNVLGQILDGNL